MCRVQMSAKLGEFDAKMGGQMGGSLFYGIFTTKKGIYMVQYKI